MQRRAFIRGLSLGLPATAALAAAGVAARSKQLARDTTEQTLDTLKAGLDELRARLEKSELSNKKMIKLALILAALSLGIDLSTLT